MAKLAATRGTCLRRKVGCILVNSRGHVLATGRNGVASGMPHCNEPTDHTKVFVDHSRETRLIPIYGNQCSGAQATSGTNLEACGAIHAEQNALLQCGDVYEIACAYVTHSPCITCVKLLMNTSCQSIIFAEPYAHDEPAKRLWLSLMGRQWMHHGYRK